MGFTARGGRAYPVRAGRVRSVARGRQTEGDDMGIYWRQGWAWARKKVRGTDYRGPLGTRSKREAETAYRQWLARLEEQIRAERLGIKRGTSFEDAVRSFNKHHLGTLAESSQIRYLQSLLVLEQHFAGRSMDEISRADLARFVTARREQGLADPSIIRDLTCLSSVYANAIDLELVEVNPVTGFLSSRRRKRSLVNSPPRTRYLTHAEELAILSRALDRARDQTAIRREEKAMIAAALALYIDTGLRAQELLSAERSWISPGGREIKVPAEMTKAGRERIVPLLPRARRIVAMLPAPPRGNALLWRAAGKPFADLNHTLQAIGADVGVADLTIHDLRRTCGCRLLQDHRLRMAEVSAWLGHASVKQTETTYAFLGIDNLHDAIGGRVQEDASRLRLLSMFEDAGDESVLALFGPERGTKRGTQRKLALRPISA